MLILILVYKLSTPNIYQLSPQKMINLTAAYHFFQKKRQYTYCYKLTLSIELKQN